MASHNQSAQGSPSPPTSPLEVLLIEDNPGDARLFEEYLSECSVEVDLRHELTLEAGLGALETETDRPDVLAVDLGLSDSEGVETVKAAVGAVPELPVVVLTGQEDLQAALQAQEAGAAEYLRKSELTPALAGRTLRWAARKHRMQRKLRQRDAWIRSITEGLSAGVFRTGPMGRIEYANEALAEMLGAEQGGDLVGQDLTAFYADSTDQGRMPAEEEAGGVEVEFEKTDGSTFVALLSAEPVYDAEGTTIHYDGTVIDITERKERERRLRMLSEAVEQAKESVLITEGAPIDEPGPQIEYVNRAYEELTGYSRDEAIGETPRMLQGPETDREVLDSLREALKAGKEWEGETVNYRKDGTPYHIQWNVSPVRGEEGEIEHWVSVQRDVTEERRREEKLRERESQFRGLTNSIPGVVYQFVAGPGPNAGYEFVGAHTETLLGIDSSPEGFHERFLSHIPGPFREKAREATEEAIRDAKPLEIELPFDRPDGERIWLLCTSTPTPRETDEGTELLFNGVMLDITERRETEQKLRRRDAQIRGLANSVPGVLFRFHAGREGYGFSFVGEQAENLLGLSTETKDLFERFLERIPDSDKELFLQSVEESVETGQPWRQEIPFRRPDGETIWLSGSAAPEEREDDIVFDGVLTDITGRKERERHIERQNDLFRRSQEIANVGAWEYEVETGRLNWTDQVYAIHGFSLEEDVTAEKAIGGYHPDDRPTIREALDQAVHEGEPFDLELRLITPEGEKRWARSRGEPVVDEGAITAVRGTMQDITDQKSAEEELRSTKNYYEQILSQIPIDLAVFTPDAEFEYMNPQSVSDPDMREWLKGRTNEDYFERKDQDLEVGQARDEAIRQAAREKETTEIEETMQTEDGPRHFLRVHTPLTNLEGEVTNVVAFGIDTTQLKERERRLKEAKDEAERMNQLKSAFLANMSHEIRTPLTSILGFAEAIGEEVRGAEAAVEVDLPTLTNFSRLIEKSGRRLMETLEGVLNLSRLEAGEMPLSAEPVDLAAQAREAAEQFEPQANKAGLELQVETKGSPVWASADKGALHIVLRNLLSNAIKYTGEGGQVWVRTRWEDDLAILEVEDTGIGMDQEKTAELFEAFKQASEGVGREYEGTGLGLTLVKELLDRMSGSIEVTTEKGEGSCFTVRLPRAEDAGETGSRETGSRKTGSRETSSGEA